MIIMVIITDYGDCIVNLGFVLIAVQESAFLPPPTQFDILYGFTDLKIIIVIRMSMRMMRMMMMRMGILYLQPSGSM